MRQLFKREYFFPSNDDYIIIVNSYSSRIAAVRCTQRPNAYDVVL